MCGPGDLLLAIRLPGRHKAARQALLEGNHPERVVEKAVERMISRNPLGRKQMKKLHVTLVRSSPMLSSRSTDVAAMNSKNKRSA